jgi:plasmid stabilization system protein ParE
MRLRFTPRAAKNIAEIADYIRLRNPQAARAVRASIFDGLRTLLLFPEVGRLQQTEGVRRLVTRKYGYFVYYLVDEAAEEVVVLSVKHKAREREHGDV